MLKVFTKLTLIALISLTTSISAMFVEYPTTVSLINCTGTDLLITRNLREDLYSFKKFSAEKDEKTETKEEKAKNNKPDIFGHVLEDGETIIINCVDTNREITCNKIIWHLFSSAVEENYPISFSKKHIGKNFKIKIKRNYFGPNEYKISLMSKKSSSKENNEH